MGREDEEEGWDDERGEGNGGRIKERKVNGKRIKGRKGK